MLKKLHLKLVLLLAAMVMGVGNVWAAENDTHSFSSTYSKLLNNSATIDDYSIAAQGYTIKRIVLNYRYNKSIENAVTVEAFIGETSLGTQDISANTTADMTFNSNPALSGAVTLKFTNNTGSGTGHGTFYINSVTLTEGPSTGGSTVATPTFNPAAGSYIGTQSVTIDCATDGAAIHYTTDGTTPTSSSATYSSAISVSSTQTIKAIGVKDGMTNSEVASATYTIISEVPGLNVDFEAGDLACYTDWTFTNITRTTSTITAHGGTYYGKTAGTASASVQTKNKVAAPGLLKFYVSKESNNTTESTWTVKVSSDGTAWTAVGDEQSATSMSKGDWVEVTRNLSTYSNVYVKIEYAGSTAVRAIDDISISPVKSVEGVSLDKSTTTIEVGSTEQLTAVLDPVDATNQAVTWETSDNAVATVSSTGLVTAVAKGTATITVKTSDGNFTATCVVTVINPLTPTATLDFTDNTDWGFPTSKDAGPDDFTDGQGYTITLDGNGEGYYFTDDVLLLGKADATLTLPAFPFNVSKIKVYGTSTGSQSVTFNIYVGEDAVSTAATNAKLDHDFVIASNKQAAGTVYVLKVTNANNTRISKIDIFGYDNITVSDAGYATYCSASALNFEDLTGLTAYTASMNGDIVEFNEAGTVAAGTGLLVEAAEGTYSVPAVATGTDVSATNKLIGTVAGTTIDGTGSDAFYVLKKKNEKVGFYRVTNSAYKVRANSAYLAVPGGSAKEFIGFDGTTGLDEELTVENVFSAPVYNLQGQRVSEAYKGVVIVNGKKFVNK